MNLIAAVVISHKQFLPDTLGGWSAIFAGIAAGLAAIVGLVNKRKINNAEAKLQEVHVLVNGGLHAKIEELRTTTDKLDTVTKQLAEAKAGAIIESNSTEGEPK